MSSVPQSSSGQEPASQRPASIADSSSAPTTTAPTQPAIEFAQYGSSSLGPPTPGSPSLPQSHGHDQAAATRPQPIPGSTPHPGHTHPTVQQPPHAQHPANAPSIAWSSKPGPVPQINTSPLSMSAPLPGPHNQQQPIASGMHRPSSAPQTQGSQDDASASTPSVHSTNSIPVPATSAHASAPTPGPATATPVSPSALPSQPTQGYFHSSAPAIAGPSRPPAHGSIRESAEEHDDGHGAATFAGPSGPTEIYVPPQTQYQSYPAAQTPPNPLPSAGPSSLARALSSSGNTAGIGAGYGVQNGGGYNPSNPGGNGERRSSPNRRTSSRAVSYSDQPVRASERYPVLPMTSPVSVLHPVGKSLPIPPPALLPGTGSGDIGLTADNGLISPRSELDWTVPYVRSSNDGGGNNGGMGMQGMPGGVDGGSGAPYRPLPGRRGSGYPGNGNGVHGRSMSMATTLTQPGGEKNVAERMQPTLDAAEKEMESARRTAKIHGWALNCAIGAQVVLGALTTGVAAATSGKQTSIATSILGGMSTLAASYLAKARGSDEPEASTIRARELESYIRDLQAFVLDHGHLAGPAVGPEHEAMIARYRRRFEEIMGHGLEGVEDTMKVVKRKDEMKAMAVSARENSKVEKSMV